LFLLHIHKKGYKQQNPRTFIYISFPRYRLSSK